VPTALAVRGEASLRGDWAVPVTCPPKRVPVIDVSPTQSAGADVR